MTFRQNISRFVTGELTPSCLPDVALQALEEGWDTPSLRVLAGLPKDENAFVIDEHFQATLRELSIHLPDPRQAAIEVGVAIADEIINGKRSVFEGVKDIVNKSLLVYPFHEETKQYVYDSIGFAKAYSLFDTIDDLQHASCQWQEDKSNEELQEILTAELLDELKQWSLAMKAELNVERD